MNALAIIGIILGFFGFITSTATIGFGNLHPDLEVTGTMALIASLFLFAFSIVVLAKKKNV